MGMMQCIVGRLIASIPGSKQTTFVCGVAQIKEIGDTNISHIKDRKYAKSPDNVSASRIQSICKLQETLLLTDISIC